MPTTLKRIHKTTKFKLEHWEKIKQLKKEDNLEFEQDAIDAALDIAFNVGQVPLKETPSVPSNEYQQYRWDSLPECDSRFFFTAKAEWHCITKSPKSEPIGDPKICEWCLANKAQHVLEDDEELRKFERKEEIKTREFQKRKELEAQIKASNKRETWSAPRIDYGNG